MTQKSSIPVLTADTGDHQAARPAPPGERDRRRGGFPFDVRLAGLVGVLVVLCLVGYVTRPDSFLTEANISTMLRLAAAIGVVSVGMTFVIISGGIDLSVGSMVALCSVWMTTLATQSFGPFVMVLCGLAVGLGCGLINGVLISYGKIVPFIATLAMYASARGLAERLSGRRTQVVSETGFTTFFRGDLLGVPVLIWMLALVFAIGWTVLNRTTFGRRTFAVGGNAEAARLAGIDVKRHTAIVYGIAGLCCGIAAIMVVARTTSGASTNGLFYELDAIAAVVIGGTLLTGGRGSLVGTLVGVLIFTVLNSIFTQNNLDTDIQNIAKGVIIVAAVLLQSTRLRRRVRAT
ncbi:ABC transporter permease [Umezawaea beigongshangensis]|uniref:ABC transporter permease n=1 Tax=Umezawaea beigongshangensis TaxID=2780383 RepID=UPI003F686E4F